ncbi:hypothetical protein KZ820_14300 [Sphingomonas sp. RRHST34]|uniref:Conjugal transfer protein TraR n=1 Tax=Sphingomonas citri TaxID=2862499 RepID=A0ABS7BQM8_9SPHN|nr:hypothetical protein [Sphingomonas citri]MBW6531909.1 hypothetical protein [Sphingomonas citri]
MSDAADEANDLAAAFTQRFVDQARAAAAQPDPVRGDCEACCDEDVMVKGAGGIMRCTPCRSKWEKRR